MLDSGQRDYANALIDAITTAEEYAKASKRLMWVMMRQIADEKLQPKKDTP